MQYRLLTEFASLFDGKPYLHRNSSLGDWVAMHLFEDLVALGKSDSLNSHVADGQWVVNVQNRRLGVTARRGDGTFGQIVPGEQPIADTGFAVLRAAVATVEIGCEVKILSKAMIKQIDRVIGDLKKQVGEFNRGGSRGDPICVAVVGVNHADYTVSYEGDRLYRTDGKSNKHPIQEAAAAERRLVVEAASSFDEFIILRYKATNEEPFRFSWLNADQTSREYGAALVRISAGYDRKFRISSSTP